MGNPRYKIGRYISIYRCDDSGNIGEVYVEEAKTSIKLTENKPLMIKTVGPNTKEISLGTIQQAKNYKKEVSVDVLTEQGWWHIVRNENLETLLGDSLEWDITEEPETILLTQSSACSHKSLVSIAEPCAQQVIDECAQSGYIIISPCEKVWVDPPFPEESPSERSEKANAYAQLFKEMRIAFKLWKKYAWMPLYEKTITQKDNQTEVQTSLKAVVIFNYYHGLSVHEVGTQEDLEGMYQLGEEIAKLFTPEATVLRPNTIEELHASYADCFLNPKPDCMSERIVRNGHGEAFISMNIEPKRGLKITKLITTHINGICYSLNPKDNTAEVDSNEEKYAGAIEIPMQITHDGVSYCVTRIGDNAFQGCKELTSVVIPEGVTSIGKFAFDTCEKLTSVVIPNSVTTIEQSAFVRCMALQSITIPNSVTTIGMAAFWWCTSLTTVDIPDSVVNIGEQAFGACKKLRSITLPNCLEKISRRCFMESGLESITIPEGINTIDRMAFHHCENLKSVTIPASVTYIGDIAFDWCDKLETIIVAEDNPVYDSRENCNAIIETATNTLIVGTNKSFIPQGITTIGENAFNVRIHLANIEIPNSVTSIEFSALAACYSLTSITIPKSVTNIGEWALEGCHALKKIYYTGTIEQWKRITLGNEWCCDTPARVIRCTNGNVKIDKHPKH